VVRGGKHARHLFDNSDSTLLYYVQSTSDHAAT
jgi:hypothetical protein